MSTVKSDIKKLKELNSSILLLPRFKEEPLICYGHDEMLISDVAGLVDQISKNYITDSEQLVVLEKASQIIRERELIFEAKTQEDANKRADMIKERDELALKIKGDLDQDKELAKKYSYFSILKKQLKENVDVLITMHLTDLEIPFEEENARIVFASKTETIEDSREALLAYAKKAENKTLEDAVFHFCQRSLIDFTSSKAPLTIIED